MRRREDEITRTGDVDGEGRKEGRREGKLVFYLVQAAAVTGPWALGGVEIADYHLADYRSTSYCTQSQSILYTPITTVTLFILDIFQLIRTASINFHHLS